MFFLSKVFDIGQSVMVVSSLNLGLIVAVN